ncbi:MAG: hypothetical protein IPG33_01365 [Betaproteobacteria bacterium]|nr:hypothetical protein [Betaproteobacteria bacterium]
MRIHIAGMAGTLAALFAASAAMADVTLHDKAALEVFLSSGSPCCVIDARSELNRMRTPLPDTLPYRKGLKINPTGVVVVVADNDARAMAVGKLLADTSKAKDVYAVKGGATTWRALTAGQATSGIRFVIPKNTCEQGVPLQELRY